MPFTTRLVLPAVALLAAWVTLPAQAQEFAPLKKLDTDGDGSVSLAEAEVAAKSQFASLDQSHDGSVSEAEFLAARQQLFRLADSNGDGLLARAELRSRLMAARQ
ncbi:MAG: hypothetical protein Q8Q73_05925 [Stagnimonas sp.]|nr:hypothetical protein [Stagnimonas sp.]